jgi:hypothetical protein
MTWQPIVTVFFLGFLWFFLLSLQTRMVAFTDDYRLHTVCTFLVSIVWMYLIKEVLMSSSHAEAFSYASGTALGSVLATFLHAKLKKFEKP